VSRATVHKTAQGAQHVLPGAERITGRELAERRIASPLRAIRRQAPADFGLFDTGARAQLDIVDLLNHEGK
jgi:hypothetical protein